MLQVFNVDSNVTASKDVLMKLPVVVTVVDFNEAGVKTFNKEMDEAHNTRQPVIPIVINSFGGSVYSLLSMVDTIRASKLPVATIVEGKAMSCGAILCSFGNEGMRYAGPNSTIMIHDVSSMAWGKMNDLKTDVNEAERLNNLIYSMLDDNCGKPRGYFNKIVFDKSRVDWYLTPQDAKYHNLVNEVRLPRLVTDVKVHTYLQ
jgi:ATP-dependent Clp protease protease subunit